MDSIVDAVSGELALSIGGVGYDSITSELDAPYLPGSLWRD